MKKINKIVIPVAGLGTRMLPATKAIPKEMLPVVNKPIIQYIIEEIVDVHVVSHPEIWTNAFISGTNKFESLSSYVP